MTSSSQPAGESPSLGQMLESIPQNVTPQQLRGLDVVIQIRSHGAEPGDWVITVKNSECTVGSATASSADLTVEATSDVWLSLVQRKLDPGWAYMSGQLRVVGDLGLAMRLQSLLSFG